MPVKKKQRSQSVKNRIAISSTKQKSPKKKATKSLNIYRNIVELPLKIFIQCFLYQKYTLLKKSGTATKIQLLKQWSIIREEYSELIAGDSGKRYINLQVEIFIISAKMKSIKIIANILASVIDDTSDEAKQLGKILNRYCQTRFDFEGEDKMEELQRCLNRTKGLQINKELKELELEAIEKKMPALGAKVDESYFIKGLMRISDHRKFNFSIETISTYEFFTRLNEYNDFCKKINEENGKQKR